MELAASGNLRDARVCWIGTPQSRPRHVQSSQQRVVGWTHAQEFGAAHPQGSFRHADVSAKLGNTEMAADMRGQLILEPDHDIGVTVPGFEFAVDIISRQAIDKRVKQFLLERSRDFRIRD
jgi:hypothetical protein